MAAHTSVDNPVAPLFTRVHELIAQQVAGYHSAHHPLAAAVSSSLGRGRVERNELSLPLLVHGAITGDAEPALPIAAVHSLWWRAANAFDDIADGDATTTLNDLPLGAGLMAAQEYGYCLPLRILEGLDRPAPLRQKLIGDFLTGWTSTNDGQLRDVTNDPRMVSVDDVVTTYQHKSSSAYIMATTMAARLAEVPNSDLALWVEFARILGVLGQLHNDQEDLDGGKGEDLSNQTATYLLVRLLDSSPAHTRQELVDLVDAAPHSAESTAALRERLLDSSNTAPVTAWMLELGRTACEILTDLGPSGPFMAELRTRVIAAATPTPLFRTTAAAPREFQTI